MSQSSDHANSPLGGPLRAFTEEDAHAAALRSMGLVLYTLDPKTRHHTMLAGAVEELLGIHLDEGGDFLESLRSLVHPDDATYFDTTVSESFSLPHPIEGKYRIIHQRSGQALWVHHRIYPELDDSGKMLRQHGVLVNITLQHRLDDALKSRIEFESLITNISRRFVNLPPEGVDSALTHTLQTVGRFSGADRAYVFVFSPDGQTMTNTHEWCNSGVEPMISRCFDLSVGDLPWFYKRVRWLETVLVPDVQLLGEEAAAEKHEWHSQSIQSLVCVPLTQGGELTGFIGLDSVHQKRDWSHEVVVMLRVVGDIISNVLEAQRHEKINHERAERYRAQNQALRDLALRTRVQERDLTEALRVISKTAAEVLGVDRVGIWMFNDPHDEADLVQLHTPDEASETPSIRLHASDYPKYFHALESERIIAADDALQDERTSEFAEGYLEPLGIRSMMDAPIRIHGRVRGIVCNEHVGLPRVWSPDEQSFAGSIADFVGLAMESWERHRAEISLKESEELYRSLVETSPDAISVSDLQGRLIMANRRAAMLHRYDSVEEMLGKHLLEFLNEEDRDRGRSDLDTVLATGSIRNVEYTVLAKDGTSFEGEISGSLVRDAHDVPNAIIIVLRDITERNRLQQQLLQTQKLESIGTLAGGIAHDFNNLLAVILGNISVLRRDTSLSVRMRDMLEDSINAAERGASLTQQLLAYARGGLQKPTAVMLNHAAKAVLDMLRRTTSPRIELEARLDLDLPPILADATQMEQVIMNLCLNAIQASEPQGRVIVETDAMMPEGERAAATPTEGLSVRLIVRDEGCGMDDETASRMFEPFFTGKAEGRGMGLSATLGIVKSHGGTIDVETKPGAGTTMTVRLPAARPEDLSPRQEHAARPKRLDPPRGSETILAVDDDPVMLRTVEQILHSLGYIVIARDDAGEALRFLETNAEDVHLALVDLHMPRYSGLELRELFLAKCPGIPVVLTSGSELKDLTESHQNPDALSLFLKKPFTVMTLAACIRQALDHDRVTKS